MKNDNFVGGAVEGKLTRNIANCKIDDEAFVIAGPAGIVLCLAFAVMYNSGWRKSEMQVSNEEAICLDHKFPQKGRTHAIINVSWWDKNYSYVVIRVW